MRKIASAYEKLSQVPLEIADDIKGTEQAASAIDLSS